MLGQYLTSITSDYGSNFCCWSNEYIGLSYLELFEFVRPLVTAFSFVIRQFGYKDGRWVRCTVVGCNFSLGPFCIPHQCWRLSNCNGCPLCRVSTASNFPLVAEKYLKYLAILYENVEPRLKRFCSHVDCCYESTVRKSGFCQTTSLCSAVVGCWASSFVWWSLRHHWGQLRLTAQSRQTFSRIQERVSGNTWVYVSAYVWAT
jgi:hypothetical protein